MNNKPAKSTNTFAITFKRDLKLLLRNSNDIIQALCFFVIIVFLFPLSLPAESKLLSTIGTGIIWVSAVLAVMMGLQSLFRSDYDDGTLEQLLISPRSLPLIILSKIISHWCATGLLISLLSPILCIALRIPSEQIWVLFLGLLLGTPALSLIGAIGSALTVTLRNGGILTAIVILPLYIPILIFGASMSSIVANGASVNSELYLLASILILALTLAPFAISAALRISID